MSNTMLTTAQFLKSLGSTGYLEWHKTILVVAQFPGFTKYIFYLYIRGEKLLKYQNFFFLQHVVQHHIHTNDVNLDPDINIEFYVRLNPTHPLLQFHMFQYIYFFFLAALFGAQKMISSISKFFLVSKTERINFKLFTSYRWYLLLASLHPNVYAAQALCLDRVHSNSLTHFEVWKYIHNYLYS